MLDADAAGWMSVLQVEDLKVQLAESERHRLTVEAQLRPVLRSEQQV